jgi:nucleoside recognition membrane protein YjiH
MEQGCKEGGLYNMVDDFSFWVGFLTASIIGFFIFLVRIWWRGVTTPFRSQVVVHTTSKTPWQIVVESLETFLVVVLVVLVLFALVSRGTLPIG